VGPRLAERRLREAAPNCAFAHPEHLKGAGSYVASLSKGGGGKKGSGPGKRGKPAAGGAAEDG